MLCEGFRVCNKDFLVHACDGTAFGPSGDARTGMSRSPRGESADEPVASKGRAPARPHRCGLGGRDPSVGTCGPGRAPRTGILKKAFKTLRGNGSSSSWHGVRRSRWLFLVLCVLVLSSTHAAWGTTSKTLAFFLENLTPGPFSPSALKFYAKRPDDREKSVNLFSPFSGPSKAAPQYREWQSLPPQEKDVLRRRLEEYRSLPPQQQQLYRQRWQQWQQIPLEERRRVEFDLQRWNELSPEQREAIRRLFQR
ncbi:DUF3106 domain-containing protein [Desulfosoma sp.]|uniref:DUF3106 domain-containing protein n=1 Tax=Desulfosoma sp. TaxID=2603217 RepID=UPI00404A9B59